jgi:hypothetical protein
MKRRVAIACGVAIGALVAGIGPGQAVVGHAAAGSVNQNGFSSPVELPASVGLGEPTIIHDSANRLFVTAPQSIGNVNTAGGSPMWTSTDGGANWAPPVRSQTCTGLSGGDTDLVADSNDNIYQTDLWLGNACLSVSSDHGKTFSFGDPYGSHLQPGDDRPWLAYNSVSNQNYTVYDGLNALHVANTGPIVSPAAGVQTVQDVLAVPETAVNSSATPNTVRACVCPPGGIAVDNSGGTHAGRIYISFSFQTGTAISYTDLTGTCPACTASPTWSAPIVIPNSGASGSAFENEWNFSPIKVDSAGTVYVMWGHAPGFTGSTAPANTAPSGVTEDYAYSKDGGTTWHGPFPLSTGGTTVFPTMDVVSPGVIDAAWYGTTATGDPNAVPATTTWNVYYTRISGADTATPSISSPAVAISGMHTGCIQSGGGAACADRSLLDFFQLTDTAGGVPNVIYTAGDAAGGVNLWFTKLASTVVVAEVPWVGALLIPAALATAVGVRRRRGDRAEQT